MASNNVFGCIENVSKDLSKTINDLGMDEDSVLKLDRADLNELLPGNENFLIRKRILSIISGFKNSDDRRSERSTPSSALSTESFSTPSSLPVSHVFSVPSPHELNNTPDLEKTPNQTQSSFPTRVPSPPSPTFVMYKDPILQQYTGKTSKEVTIPESVVSTLVRGTISNMVTGCQGVPGRDYPHSHEIIAVAKHLIDIYPCLERIKPNGKPTKGVFLAKLQKRLRNVKPVKNPQGKIPQRSKLYKKENGQLDSDKIDERKNQQHQQQQQNHKTTNLRTQVPAQKSLNFEDNDEDLFQQVQNIAQITQTNSDALDRYSVYLDRELESSKPDDETLTRYCDLLFESRRETILGVNYERRMALIKSNHKVLVQQPMQLIREVGRILHQETKMFTQEVIKRLSVLTDSLLPYVYTKFNTNKSLIETLHNPNFNISWTKLVSILSVIDVLFDGKKKKKSIVQLIHDEDDPNIKRKLLLPELPGLMVEVKTGKAFVMYGAEILQTVDQLPMGLLCFYALFYVLNVDYPNECATFLSILQRLIFKDIRCIDSHCDKVENHLEELRTFLPYDFII